MRLKCGITHPSLRLVGLFFFFSCLAQMTWSQKQPLTGVDFIDFKLENGLRVIVIKDTASQYFTADLLVDYPLVLEGEQKGVGTLVNQNLSAGTKSHSKAEIDALLRSANCTLDATVPRQLKIEAPLKERETVLALLAELVQQATFPADELVQPKAALQRSIAEAENSVFAQSTLLSNQLSFGADHPYGERTTLESLAKISSETCQQFYKKYYRPVVSYLVVTGNIQVKEVRFLVEKYFGNWQVQGAMFSAFYNPAPLPLSTRLSFVHVPGASDLSLDFGYTIPLRPGTDDELKVALLKELLAIHLNQASWNKNSEKLVFSANPHIGLFRIHADDFPPAMAEEVIGDILGALGLLRKELVAPTDLATAKANLLAKDFRFPNFLSFSNRKANEALSILRFKLPRNYYDNDPQRINEITAGDILEVAREYLLPGRAHIVVAGDQAIAPSLAHFAGDGKVHYYTREGKEIEAMGLELATEDITAEAVIEKYLAAIGGRERLNEIKDFHLEAGAKIQGTTMVMTRTKKNDEKFFGQFRIDELELAKVVFDGNNALIIRTNIAKEITEEDLEMCRSLSTIFPQLKYHEEGWSLKLTGSAVLNEQNVYIVEVTNPTGRKSNHYFDARSGFLLRSTGEREEEGLVTDYREYRAVDGIKFPHQIIMTDFFEEPLLFKVTSLQLNQGISDQVFKVK
ncbi:insulinase family protein [Lewinella sp. LCG006]|uniref:insulinase family protein n=1 Tax=Lewinella sp. LCG006 TaxID=3231911 RepID=UPI00345F94E8